MWNKKMNKLYKYIFFTILLLCFTFAFGEQRTALIQDTPSDKDDKSADSEKSDEDKAEDEEPQITTRIRKAINSGLSYLASQQNRDGSYGGSYDIATCGLAGLAFVAGGHLPNRGEYAENVEKLVKHLLKVQNRDTGYYHSNNDSSRIHGHGYAGLFLAEILGMLTDKDLHDSVKSSIDKAAKLSAGSQTKDGGWGYIPQDETFDEGSTTITQIQFLRAARDAGMNIPKRKINNAIRYVYKCAMQTDYKGVDGKNHLGYTFKYSLSMNYNRSSYPLTAAAASVLQGTGIYEGEILEGALGWMRYYFNKYSDESADSIAMNWFYYAQFYAAQAFWHSNDSRDWWKYYNKVANILVSMQNTSNGSWNSYYGNAYSTAIATMILAIPDRFLPLFQK